MKKAPKLNLVNRYLNKLKRQYNAYVETLEDSSTFGPISFDAFVRFKGFQEIARDCLNKKAQQDNLKYRATLKEIIKRKQKIKSVKTLNSLKN